MIINLLDKIPFLAHWTAVKWPPTPISILTIIIITIILIMIILMKIHLRNHGWVLMGSCTIATMDWHHIHTNPFTHQAISAEELLLSLRGISMKGLLLLALVGQLVPGTFYSLSTFHPF